MARFAQKIGYIDRATHPHSSWSMVCIHFQIYKIGPFAEEQAQVHEQIHRGLTVERVQGCTSSSMMHKIVQGSIMKTRFSGLHWQLNKIPKKYI